jgi:hypothetical protein
VSPQTSAEVLSARYVAIRTSEAAGLTDRLLQVAGDKTPGVRRMLAPMLVRFWHRDRERGWLVLEEIARRAVKFGGVPDSGISELFGAVSVAILDEARRSPTDFERLRAMWRQLFDRLQGAPLARGLRVMGRGFVLRLAAAPLAERLRHQPSYQPLNYPELEVTFARPDDFRWRWRQALGCLQHPETAPAPIVELLSDRALPFDLYLMLCCERALIYHGACTDPAGAMDTAEALFDRGARWFRPSLVFLLFHVLSSWPHVDDATLGRYDDLTLRYYRDGDWLMPTTTQTYERANLVANVDVLTAHHSTSRTPHVVVDLLDEGIATGDQRAIGALLTAVDGVAFYHRDGALALTMLEHAYVAGGAAVEDRVMASMASVRLADQPLVDAFLAQRVTFTRIKPEDVAATEPSVGDDDFNTLIDQFVVQSMLTSADFRAQLCRAFERALTVRDVKEFLVQIMEWVRDEVGRLSAAR